MDKIDKTKEDVLETIMWLLYNEMYPLEDGYVTAEYINGRLGRAIKKFQNDPMFNAKVRTATARIIKIVF